MAVSRLAAAGPNLTTLGKNWSENRQKVTRFSNCEQVTNGLVKLQFLAQ